MTAAIELLKKHKIRFLVYEYKHESDSSAYGLEAVDKLGLDPAQVFKPLVAAENAGLAVAVVAVSEQFNLKAMAAAMHREKLAMAAPAD
ncbi:MAG: Cys-tRNA(Pro)/Cys-tRNA(Cys) deacylase [Zhongshania sp.]|jgi:Cys-tRNA(Pro)/Cys-tRNA(Cys) deacylase